MKANQELKNVIDLFKGISEKSSNTETLNEYLIDYDKLSTSQVSCVMATFLCALKSGVISSRNFDNLTNSYQQIVERQAIPEIEQRVRNNPDKLFDLIKKNKNILSENRFKYLLLIAIDSGLNVDANIENITSAIFNFKDIKATDELLYQNLNIQLFIKHLVSWTRIVLIERSVLLVSNDKGYSYGENSHRVLSALLIEPEYKEMASHISDDPLYLRECLFKLYKHLISDPEEIYSKVVLDSYRAGISCLPRPNNIIQPLHIDDVSLAVVTNFKNNINYIEAYNLLILSAFSGRDEVSKNWRDVFRNQYSSEEELMNVVNNATNSMFIMAKSSMSTYGSFLLDQAEQIFISGNQAFNDGQLMDGGMVSLAYFRVLEIELNYILYKAFKANYKIKELFEIPAKKIEYNYRTKLFEKMVKMQNSREFAPMVTLEKIEEIFNIAIKQSDYSMNEPDLEADKLLRDLKSVLTSNGCKVFFEDRKKILGDLIGEGPRTKFRNPPAHATYADFSVALRCKQHVLKSLLTIYGHATADGIEAGLFDSH